MEPSRVSVVVPVHGGGEAFASCVAALRRLDPAPLEVVVAADEDEASALRAEEAGFRVIRLRGPVGPARARNAAARLAEGDVLFFLDADVVPRPDAVARVAQALTGTAPPDAVFGSYDDDPADPGFLSQYRNLLHHYVHQQGREDAATFWAGCGAVRRDVFREAGGFDETYATPSIEDIELGLRLVAGGRRIRLLKDLQVRHLKRWTAWSVLHTDVVRRAVPWTLLIHRHRALPDDLNLRWAARASALLGVLVVASPAAALALPAGTALAMGAAALLAFGALNLGFYRFLARVRGAGFAVAALPWHLAYFVYSAGAFVAGTALHYLGPDRRQRATRL
jgi:GT2 family glycosyltransferase